MAEEPVMAKSGGTRFIEYRSQQNKHNLFTSELLFSPLFANRSAACVLETDQWPIIQSVGVLALLNTEASKTNAAYSRWSCYFLHYLQTDQLLAC